MIYGRVTGRMIPFYDTADFNSWSVSNFDRLHRYPQHEPEHYKRELKEYIYAFDGNRNYLEGKGKNPSWRMCDASDGEYAQTYPVIAIAMESPSEVRVVRSGEYFIPSCNESVRRRDMSMKLALPALLPEKRRGVAMSFYAMSRDCIVWPLLPKYFHTDDDALAVYSRNSNGPISRDRFGYLNRFSKVGFVPGINSVSVFKFYRNG